MIWREYSQAPAKVEASVSILVEGAKRSAAAARTPIVLDAVKASLESWADEDSQFAQGKFWQVLDYIQDYSLHLNKLNFELPDRSDLSFGYTLNFDKWTKDQFIFYHDALDRNRVYAEAPHHSFVVDGLQRLRTISLLDFSQEISAKSARRAIKATLSVIDNLGDTQSDFDLVALVGSTLSEKIAAVVKLVVRYRAIFARRPPDDETRDRVLNFSIHTGNSPPSANSASRLAAGRALVSLITDARRENYATVQGQEIARNLRNTICEKRARTRFSRGAQNNANHGGSWQPARYRPPLSHNSLAKCA